MDFNQRNDHEKQEIFIRQTIPETSFTYPILLGTLALNSLRRAEFKSFVFGDYLIDQSYYRLRGSSYENARTPGLIINEESIPERKIQPTDM